MTNMWSVKTVPNASSLSLGFVFFVAARLILIGSLISSPPSPTNATASSTSFSSAALEDYRLAVEPERLTVYVGDLAEARVVLHGVDEHRHHVLSPAARVDQLLEPPFDLRPVARGFDALDALDLLALDGRVDLEVVDGAHLRHHVLVDPDDDLVAAILHQLVPVRGVRDLPLRVARIDGANDAAHRVDLPDVVVGGFLHLVRQRLEIVRAPMQIVRL